MMTLNLSLYLVTDPRSFGPHGFMDSVKLAVDGGVTAVQLREKTASKDEIREKAIRLMEILSPRGIPLIINDYVEIAKEIGAQGVHLGKKDCDIKKAREIMGSDAIVGLSVETVRDFERSDFALCDYVSASPVFQTPTKEDTERALGLDGLRRLREACPIPLIGIGGIHLKNVPSLAVSGVDGIAVVSKIMWDSDPKRAATDLKLSFMRSRLGGKFG